MILNGTKKLLPLNLCLMLIFILEFIVTDPLKQLVHKYDFLNLKEH